LHIDYLGAPYPSHAVFLIFLIRLVFTFNSHYVNLFVCPFWKMIITSLIILSCFGGILLLIYFVIMFSFFVGYIKGSVLHFLIVIFYIFILILY